MRKLDDARKWAPNWFDYPEAVTLVQALWLMWEQMRLDGPQAILVFYRGYFYPMMDRLTGPEGPFHAFGATTNPQLPEPWATTAAPAGNFPRRRTSLANWSYRTPRSGMGKVPGDAVPRMPLRGGEGTVASAHDGFSEVA
ncbi:hypothetical protein JOF47_003956 [Paeniglutamicibacter kerguelensis]|uniref:DUF4913 domain-containing protein n=1 Tax=Paeniglutamicibacter kerguelensis TaxID=254788 RepID=A0ABS4XIZ8_9MICC|nr:hypothetical protein [Paeniglutamicibacter kerguelensis]